MAGSGLPVVGCPSSDGPLPAYSDAMDLVEALLESYPSQKEFLQNDWWFRPLWLEPRFQELTAESG